MSDVVAKGIHKGRHEPGGADPLSDYYQVQGAYGGVYFLKMTGDVTTALSTLIAAAAAAGGGTILAGWGIGEISAAVTVPDGVNLLGLGGGNAIPFLLTSPATRFKCTAVGAQIAFAGRGGRSGEFVVDGNAIATNPVAYLATCVQREFHNLQAMQGVGDGVTITAAQNNRFYSCDSEWHGGSAVVLDQGAGGNRWFGGEFNECGAESLVFKETTGTGPYVVPTDNIFYGPIFERQSGGGALVLHSAGVENKLVDPNFSANSYTGSTSPFYCVDMQHDGTFGGSWNLIVERGLWQGKAGDAVARTAMRCANGARLVISGPQRWTSFDDLFEIASVGAIIEMIGDIDTAGPITNTYTAGITAANQDTYIARHRQVAESVKRPNATDRTLAVGVIGDSTPYTRWKQQANGTQIWGDGNNTFDANLYRGAAKRLQTDQAFRAADGLMTKYLTGAGKTTVTDADFTTTLADGAMAVHYDTTASKTYLSVRANGTWHVMSGPI